MCGSVSVRAQIWRQRVLAMWVLVSQASMHWVMFLPVAPPGVGVPPPTWKFGCSDWIDPGLGVLSNPCSVVLTPSSPPAPKVLPAAVPVRVVALPLPAGAPAVPDAAPAAAAAPPGVPAVLPRGAPVVPVVAPIEVNAMLPVEPGAAENSLSVVVGGNGGAPGESPFAPVLPPPAPDTPVGLAVALETVEPGRPVPIVEVVLGAVIAGVTAAPIAAPAGRAAAVLPRLPALEPCRPVTLPVECKAVECDAMPPPPRDPPPPPPIAHTGPVANIADATRLIFIARERMRISRDLANAGAKKEFPIIPANSAGGDAVRAYRSLLIGRRRHAPVASTHAKPLPL
jgi:hypothetical protein